jgi:lipopolysaccharide heptosyltransferase II
VAGKTDWSNYKNVLCIRPDNLGDVLMTSPALRALKDCVPGRKITLLTSRVGQSIAKYIPEVDACIAFDVPWYKHESPESVPELFRVVEEIRSCRFEAAVIFTVFSQNPLPTAMLCYMAGIPRIAGYCRENPYRLITDWVVDNEPLYVIKHEVVRQLDLVNVLGAESRDDSLSLSVPGRVLAELPMKLRRLGVRVQDPWLIVHPGVSEAKRQYPVELFAETVRRIADDLGYQVLLTGVDSERDLAGYITSVCGKGVISLAGKLTLAELVALVKLSPLLISNYTGPVHIAAAVKTPVIVLYALTNPQHTPWRVKHRILPFDVPRDLRSRNAVIRYANEKYFPATPGEVSPAEIIEVANDFLNGREYASSGTPEAGYKAVVP